MALFLQAQNENFATIAIFLSSSPKRNFLTTFLVGNEVVAFEDVLAHLDVAQGILLVLGKGAHLRLRETDVVEVAGRKLGEAGLNLGSAEPVILAVPAIEPYGHFPYRRQPSFRDVRQRCLNDGTHPDGFEWCVNAPAVDATGTVYANSEDGWLYAIGQGGVLKQKIFTQLAIGAAYTPLSIGPDGKIYTQNYGQLFVIGQ